MSPDQINEKHGASYKCRPCGAASGLRWWAGTSCPVCTKPECAAALAAEYQQAAEDDAASDAYAYSQGYL